MESGECVSIIYTVPVFEIKVIAMRLSENEANMSADKGALKNLIG